MNLKFNVLTGKIIPVIRYDNMKLLFDTGASTPVWCYDVDSFKTKFPEAKKMDYRFLLTGFGRSEAELVRFLKNPDNNSARDYFADVYNIPEFILKTDEGCIIWKGLNVAVMNRRFSGVHMILPYTMFGGMSLKFNQNTVNPEIVIESSKNTKYTFVKLNNNFSKKVLQYIYVQKDEPEQGLTKVMDIF
ncbi:MAG: hypothetical protein HFH68_01485 [Lachnospiraceae bacterium]|nr:hypothetical protein [Lachnospiraceae bacterium]